MTVVHFDENNLVDLRFLWATSIDDVVVRKGGVASDYAIGDYPMGSTRDPETGEITPFSAPEPNTAELAATLSLASSDFWIALHLALIEKGALGFEDDIQAHVLTAIDAGVAAEVLSVVDAMAARILVRTAVTFHRADPARPGLLDGVGALVGLTLGEIDAIFVATAEEAGT